MPHAMQQARRRRRWRGRTSWLILLDPPSLSLSPAAPFALSVCAARHADVRVNIFSPKSSVRPSVRPSDMYTFFEVSEAAAIEIVGKREKRRRFSSDR